MPEDANDIDLLAASLRADAADTAAFVEAIARKLEAALPDRTKVTRKRVSFLSLEKRVEKIVIDLGEERLLLDYDGANVGARVAKVTRGITIKTEERSLDDWIDELARAIDAQAQSSERGRQAMERLLGVGP